ncbi:cell division protein ZapA [Novosphingobium kunmingense]|uniref:Cell division protein ZapA n=1 Tax=Novosphingobium kunmingense TaxID=1211806 RepID=A0A2N0I1V4_9SPHN|nr:cell division protein ZapA [Novosphingobium kunmingense]PKB25151.1 cell division protein ZapA [Novosphingobium kunmingense]
MSNVTLQIGGRSYTVACADGEEEHIAALGRKIGEKVEQLGPGHSEVRQLLFAALLLSDELHEARGRPDGTSGPVPATGTDDSADLLESIADRLEKVALSLEA